MFCKSGKKVFTRVVLSKFNFLLYCMFDTQTLSVMIFSFVTCVNVILQQFVDIVVKYKCNVFAYVEGKIVVCDCQ